MEPSDETTASSSIWGFSCSSFAVPVSKIVFYAIFKRWREAGNVYIYLVRWQLTLLHQQSWLGEHGPCFLHRGYYTHQEFVVHHLQVCMIGWHHHLSEDVILQCTINVYIMAYGSTPYVGMTPKKNGGHIQSAQMTRSKCPR